MAPSPTPPTASTKTTRPVKKAAPSTAPGRKKRQKPKRNQPWPANRPVPSGWKRTRKGRIRKRSLTWRFRRVLLMIPMVMIVLMSAGIYVIWNTTELPQKDPPLLQTSFICAADVTSNCNQDNSIAQLSGSVDRVNVTYNQIPGIFIQALVSAEDKDFFRHQGVDPVGVGRALYQNLKNEKVSQGGSTITQQYVKNVYLTNEQTVDRKVKEAVLAIKLDRELPKQEILERYLNTIYFGRGAYGIEAASRVYFGKHVEQLDLADSAYLAAIISSPEGRDANRQPTDPLREAQHKAALDHRRQVLDTMVEQGYITQAVRDEVNAHDIDYVLPRPTGSTNIGKVAHPELGTEYFIDYVRHWLVNEGIVDDAKLYGGGLRVYTTLDFTAQQAAYNAIRSTLDRPNDPAASIVSIDDKGRVRAMVGGFDYQASQVNLAVGAAGGGSGRQPGSSFKPLVLAQYLNAGLSLGARYDAPPKKTISTPLGTWSPANYGDAAEGNLDVVEATAVSSNTAYAQIEADTMKASGGIDPIIDTAHRLGITADLPKVNSLVLGSGEVSVLDMASAYSTFANEGERRGPFVVTKVTDAQGNVVWPRGSFEDVGKEQAIPKVVAQTVSYALTAVTGHGTGTNANFGQTVAGKTGTTEDYHDAWFIGYTCKMTAAVWVGYPTPGQNGQPKYLQGIHGINVVGGTFPAQIFSKFMKVVTQGLTSCPFPLPPGANFTPSGTFTAGSAVPGTEVVGTTEPTTPGTTAAPGTTAVTTPASSTTSSSTPASSTTTEVPPSSTTTPTTAPVTTTSTPAPTTTTP